MPLSRFHTRARLGWLAATALGLFLSATAHAFDRPEVTFQVFQFPADKIPRVDGDPSDWAMVPESYAIKTDQFVDDSKRHATPDPKTLDVKIRVGWVKGLNRLYFLYEAYDDCWDFADPGLRNDTFEIVVDGDASGGPLIDKSHAYKKPGNYVTVLEVTAADGKTSRRSKVWDVQLR